MSLKQPQLDKQNKLREMVVDKVIKFVTDVHVLVNGLKILMIVGAIFGILGFGSVLMQDESLIHITSENE